MNWSISRLSSSSRGTGSSRGFTLVEVLVAISILAILMTSVYGIFTSVSVARERLDADSADYHRARVIFDRMGRELRGTYFQARDRNLVFTGGVSDESSASLELTTTAVSPLSQTGSGLARIRYLLVADPEDADRRPGPDAQRVSRRMTRYLTRGLTGMMRLAPGVETMTLRFFANGQWQEKWDGRASGLAGNG